MSQCLALGRRSDGEPDEYRDRLLKAAEEEEAKQSVLPEGWSSETSTAPPSPSARSDGAADQPDASSSDAPEWEADGTDSGASESEADEERHLAAGPERLEMSLHFGRFLFGLADGEQHRASGDAVDKLLEVVRDVCGPGRDHDRKRRSLHYLASCMKDMYGDTRRAFTERALALGIVDAAVELLELGINDLACAAFSFLALFTYTDMANQCVLQFFDRITNCFKCLTADVSGADQELLQFAIWLCGNIAASCPSSHARLMPFLEPVCLHIIRSRSTSSELKRSTILLLANMSATVGPQLRACGIGHVLLDYLNKHTSRAEKSVAETVVIVLHGHTKSEEMDELMARRVVSKYCVPLMERTLTGASFRGMRPFLFYSALIFQVLAKSREYAKALAANQKVVPLLLRAVQNEAKHEGVASGTEGRRLALEALRSLSRYHLWPTAELGEGLGATERFLREELPELVKDPHDGIRTAAADLWASTHASEVLKQLLVGQRLESFRFIPAGFWRTRILSFLYPFLDSTD